MLFTPTAAGQIGGTLTVSDSATDGAVVTLSGTGATAGALIASPSPAPSFAPTLTGVHSTEQLFTITNGGAITTGSLTASLTGTDQGQYAITTNNCNGIPDADWGRQLPRSV